MPDLSDIIGLGFVFGLIALCACELVRQSRERRARERMMQSGYGRSWQKKTGA